MNQQRDRTLQQTVTTLGAAEVLAAAKHFFARRNSIYAAFVEKEGPIDVSNVMTTSKRRAVEFFGAVAGITFFLK